MEEINSSDSKDRISALPDSLIHFILSFIDMRYAVQSSVLSKRWRYIWTSLPTLNFCVEEGYNVADFVNKVLWFRDSCCIQRFYLDAFDDDFDSTHMYSWISVALRRNVEELDISFICSGDFVIPPCLCTSKSLTKLDLYVHNSEGGRGKIILPTSVSLPRLKSMYLNLENLLFDDEYLTNKFFSSCPALESLDLGNSHFVDMNLNISLLKLKRFDSNINLHASMNLDTSSSTDTLRLTLYAPNLTTLDFSVYKLGDYSLENLSSVVTAHIGIQVETDDVVLENRIELVQEKKFFYARHMMELVRTLQNVKILNFSEHFKVLSGAFESLGNQLPQFLNLHRLGLTTWLSRDCMRAIVFLLKISPNLETLCLDIATIHSNKPSLFLVCDEINFDSRSVENFWDSELSLPCVLYHLKFVRIQGLRGCVNELKFIEILLKNSVVLEKMVLTSYSVKKDPLTVIRMLKFYERVLAFPKASARCIIISNPSGRRSYSWHCDSF